MKPTNLLRIGLPILAFYLGACGGTSGPTDGGMNNGGFDAGRDGGVDGGFDAGPAVVGSASLFGSEITPTGIAVTLSGQSGVSLSTSTTDDGSYSFEVVPDGTYSLTFESTVSVPGWAADGGLVSVNYGTALADALSVPVDGGLAPVELFPGQLLQAGEGFSSLLVSPDGRTIVVLFDAGPFPLGLDGGALDAGGTDIGSTPTNGLAFSPNGLLLADLAGGQLWIDTLPSGLPYYQIASNDYVDEYQFSPDSSMLALLASNGDGGMNLGLAPSEGAQNMSATLVATDVSEFLFAPVGSALAFVTDGSADGGSALELAATGDGGLARVSAFGPLGWFGFSPNGEELAFVNSGVLSIVATAGGSAAQISLNVVVGGSVSPSTPVFSPDGRTLAFVAAPASGENGLFVVPSVGGNPVELMEGVTAFQFSPDSQNLAVLEGSGTLDLVPVGSNNPTQIAEGVTGPFAFSPDGSELAFGVGWTAQTSTVITWYAGSLEVAPVAGGSAPATVADNVAFFEFSDSSHLAFLTDWGGGSGTLEIDQLPPAGPAQVATDVAWFQPSPDGSRIAFASFAADGAFSVLGVAGSAGAASLLLMDDLPMPQGSFMVGEAPDFSEFPPLWAPQWAAGHLLVGLRQGSSKPYGAFQDGIYSFMVP